MQMMTPQQNKENQPKTGQLCQFTKIPYKGNSGGLQN